MPAADRVRRGPAAQRDGQDPQADASATIQCAEADRYCGVIPTASSAAIPSILPVPRDRLPGPATGIPSKSPTKKLQGNVFMTNKKLSLLATATALCLLSTQAAFAQKKYDTGASATE